MTCPLEGRIVAVPPVTARMIREGPGGSVAVQLPFGSGGDDRDLAEGAGVVVGRGEDAHGLA